jgi:hypothetical protein
VAPAASAAPSDAQALEAVAFGRLQMGCTPACMSIGVYIRVSSAKGQKTGSHRVELEAWLKRQRVKPLNSPYFKFGRFTTPEKKQIAFNTLRATVPQ